MAKNVNPTQDKPKVVDKNSNAFDRVANKIDKKYSKDREFNVAKMTSNKVNLSQTDYDRYVTYGSKTFGKLGFDINRDNAEFYNNRTTNSQEIWRSTKGFFKLAGVGFQDTIALGSLQSKTASKDFADIMQDYSIDSRRKSSFWGNTLLSAGYTAGIIGAVAAEEIAIGALTGGLGLIGSGGMVGRGLNSAFTKLGTSRAARLAGGGRTNLEMMQHLDDIQRAEEAYQAMNFTQKAFKGAKEFGKDIIKNLNPVGNTATFLKDLEKMNDLNGFVKMANGAGALYRDARKFTMTHGESRLEADMNRDEYLEERTKELKDQNGGAPLSDEQMDLLRAEADKVHTQTYMGNFGLIYATNAIGFDNMFKSMKFNNNWIRNIQAGKNTMRNIGKANAEFVTENLGISLKRGFRNWTAKTFNPGNLVRTTLGNYAEGFQELQQDAISEAAQQFVRRTKVTKQNEGNYFQTIFNDLTDHVDFIKNDVNLKFIPKGEKEGTTFWAGALMGFMASPVSVVVEGVQKATIGKGYKYLSKDFRTGQEETNKKNQQIARILNATFQTNLDKAYDAVNKPLFQQVEIQEKLQKAIEDGDLKTVQDLKDQAFTVQSKMLLDTNADGEFADHLETLANKASIKTLGEAIGRTDLNESNVEKVRENLRSKALTLRKLRAVHDEINTNFVSPINPRLLAKGDPNYAEKYHKYQAAESLKKDLLFSHATILNNIERTKGIERKIEERVPMLELNSLEGKALLSSKDMDLTIESLNTEIKSMREIGSSRPEEKARLEVLQKRANALADLKVALDNSKKSFNNNENNSLENFTNVKDAIVNYLGTFSVNVKNNPSVVEDIINDVYDYHVLDQDTAKLQEHINFLNDPEYANIELKNKEKLNKARIARLENQIKDSLDAFEERVEVSKLMQILTEKGLIFDMNELDDLTERGIMPSKIYNAVTHKEATPSEEAEVHRIIEAFYKKLTNKKIANDKSSLTRAGAQRTAKDKRTVKDIIKEYRLKVDENIDLSTPSGQSLIKRVLKSGNLRATDIEILEELLDKGGVIKFVTNAEMPIVFNDGVTTIDLRFAGSEFRNTKLSFEGLFTAALLQDKVARKITSSPEFAGEVSQLMQQTKEAAVKEYGVINDEFFKDPVVFLVEAMNNRNLQKLMQSVTDDTNVDTKSVWFSLSALIKRLIKATLSNKTLIDRAVYLTKVATTDGELIKAEEVTQEETTTEEPVAEEETPQPEAEQEETQEEPIDREDFLRNEIEDRKAELQRYQSELNSVGKNKAKKVLSFRKMAKLKNKIAELNIEINDLTEELMEYVPVPESTVQAPFVPVKREADKDIYGNIILNENAPFKALPLDVVRELTNIYGKDIMNLGEFEQEQVRKIIAENPVIIKMLKEHNENTFAIYDENRIILENEKSIEDAKILNEKRRQQWQESIDEGKAQRKQNAQPKEQVSTRDILMLRLDKAGFPIEDLDLLTNKQVEDLFVKLRAKEIGIEDVFDVIQRKKLLKQQRAQKKYEKEMQDLISAEIEQESAEQERLDAVSKVIAENRKLLEQKLITEVIQVGSGDKKKNKGIKVRVPRSHTVFYETYYPNLLLIKSKAELIEEIKFIKANIKASSNTIAKNISFSENKAQALNELVDLFIELDAAKLLFPTIANKINKALRDSNLPYRITMAKTIKGEQLVGTMYKIRYIETGKIKSKPRKVLTVENARTKEDRKRVALDYKVIGKSDIDKKLLALQTFIGGVRVTKDFMSDQVVKSTSEIEINRKRTLISEDGKSRLDTIFSDNELLREADDSEDAAIEVLKDHDTISEMIETAFDIVKTLTEEFYEQQKQQAEEAAGREANEQRDSANDWDSFINSEAGKQYLEDMYKDEQDFMTAEQQDTALVEFYASEEGKEYFEEYQKDRAKYFKSTLFLIEMGAFEGDPSTLEGPEKEMYLKAVENGVYAKPKTEEKEEGEEEQEAPKKPAEEKTKFQLNDELMNEAEMLNSDLTVAPAQQLFEKPAFTYYNAAVNKLNEKPTLKNLVLTLAAFSYGKIVSPAQMNKFANDMVNNISKFSTKNSNEIVIINNKSYEVLPGLANKKIQLKELNTEDVMQVTFEEFPTMVSDVVTIGEDVKTKDGSTFENTEDFETVSGAILNVFNNFGKFIKEGIAVPENEQELKDGIIEKLNICK